MTAVKFSWLPESDCVLVIREVFDEDQLSQIWQELRFLHSRNVFLKPEQTEPATNSDGSSKKANKSVFLDYLYAGNRDLSAVMSLAEKVILSKEVKDEYAQNGVINGLLRHGNQHSTLLNYYEQNDHYDFHHDESAFSTLTYFFEEPQQFEGGQLQFRLDDDVVSVPVENNMTIIFPSCIQHAVVPVKMQDTAIGETPGRFSLAQFVAIAMV